MWLAIVVETPRGMVEEPSIIPPSEARAMDWSLMIKGADSWEVGRWYKVPSIMMRSLPADGEAPSWIIRWPGPRVARLMIMLPPDTVCIGISWQSRRDRSLFTVGVDSSGVLAGSTIRLLSEAPAGSPRPFELAESTFWLFSGVPVGSL